MLKFFAAGLGASLGFGAWRQYHAVNGSIVVVLVFACIAFVAAFYGGRARRPIVTATAVAVAKANAAANAQQAVVVNIDTSARRIAAERFGGLDAVAWQSDSESIESLDPELAEIHGIEELATDPGLASRSLVTEDGR